MTRFRRTALVFASALISVTVAACGGGSGGAPSVTSDASTAPAGAQHVTVTIKDFAYHPASLTVSPGTKVTFVNEDSVIHTATGSGSSSMIASPNLTQGQSYTITFTKAGTYNYICAVHPYMEGTVIVR